MGMLPIGLALTGFVLLWALVNYSTFANQRAAVGQLLGTQKELLQVRGQTLSQLAVLLQMHQIALPPYLLRLANDSSRLGEFAPVNDAMEQVREQSQSTPLPDNPDYTKTTQTLKKATERLFATHRQLRVTVADYNRRTRSMPSRIIASVFGFKKIDLAA